MRVVPYLMAFVFLLGPAQSLAADDPKSPDPHFELVDLDPNAFDDLVERASRNALWGLRGYRKAEGQTKRTIDLWKGNSPNYKATIRQIGLTFESEEEIQEPFNVFVTFGEKSIVVRNSRARFKETVGGIKVQVNPQKAWKFVVDGSSGGSVSVIVPKHSTKMPSQGLVICPRDTSMDDSRKLIGLHKDTGYRVRRLQTLVDGSATGQLLSGLNVGLAMAYVQTTKNVAPGYPHFDRVEIKDPYVSIEYRDSGENEFSPNWHKAGVRSALFMHNSAGHMRELKAVDGVYIKEVQIPKTFRARFVNAKVSVEKGTCYAIIRQPGIEARYDRYPRVEQVEEKVPEPTELLDDANSDDSEE